MAENKRVSSRPLVFVAGTSKKDPRKEHTVAFARLRFGMTEAQTKDIQWVENWEQFYTTLAQYSSIDKLVIYTHGVPGGMAFGSTFRSLPEVAKGFGDKEPPRVQEIVLEGCNVGMDPASMVPFGERLGAQKISAYSYFMAEASKTIQIPSGISEAQSAELQEKLEKQTSPFKRYLIPGQPTTEQLIRSPGSRSLYYEWFRPDLIGEYPEIRNDQLPPKDIQTRESASEVEYRTSQSVPGRTNDLITPFEHVTIYLDRKAEPAAKSKATQSGE